MSAPAPITVTLGDGTAVPLGSLLSRANYKQAKGKAFLSVGLTLTPRDTAGTGLDLCEFATQGCGQDCFADADRLAWPANKRVAEARTTLLATDPAAFVDLLKADLNRAVAFARRKGLPLAVRLNVVSDFPFEEHYPELYTEGDLASIQYYDYTKVYRRLTNPDRPSNLHLTFSRSEGNSAHCRRALELGFNVCAVIRVPKGEPFPRTLILPGNLGTSPGTSGPAYPVWDGDLDDLRFLDPPGHIIGVRPKGPKARKDYTSGFVIDP